MLGVAIKPDEIETAREFFELFKTPWELVVPGRTYRALLSTIGRPDNVRTELLIAFGRDPLGIDRAAGVGVALDVSLQLAEWAGSSFPLYMGALRFDGGGPCAFRCGATALDYRSTIDGVDCWRIGYDLFQEVQYLLSEGQPPAQALTPTLDIHSAVLRHLLLEAGVSFIEIPPHPLGRNFICCLTHDIDFFGIRRHIFDRTLAGFILRGSLGTLVDLLRGRRPLREALRNWTAVLSLPLVFLGALPDFWRPLEDYERADGARPSTFFVVPFRDRAGVAPDGGAEPARAVRYQASDVASQLQAAAARGRELAVHGIDAWRDEDSGRAEMAQVAPLGGRAAAGVRMHWLYFASDSPGRIEAAGFDYDSTCGYNDAVGYRAGTSQVFSLPGSERLMELPIAIMDTALFYPGRLGLARDEALERCRTIVAHARRAGGTVVVNWHDRSLAPERFWGQAYDELLDELDDCSPWFATATDAVEWFRWRRSVTFACEPDGAISVRGGPLKPGLPGASIAVHRPASDVADELVLGGGETLRVGL
jgi:hypothetical protein